MQNFQRVNNLVGWLVFIIAAATYILTMEPVASFWDCGEFIAASYKLQVPHPPGAPLFLLVGRLFSFLALGDVTRVAYYVNMVSALSSAGASLFLFWTITMLARKLVGEPESGTDATALKVLFAGLVGSLAYTYADSAWFSASEAEVYAMSSLFTALVFWAILRWERVADEVGADRWLLLIAYFTGLSIGVHLLNLVTMPALAFVYYFRRYQYSALGAWATFGIGMVVVGAIMVGIIPSLPSFANFFEITFVNSFGLPFNSGIIFFLVLFFGTLIYLFSYAKRSANYFLFNGLLAFCFIMIGYISYGVIVVRAVQNPPINENDPSNAISVVSYLKREQYGDRPLLNGPVYNSQASRQENGAPIYIKGTKDYEKIGYKTNPVYEAREKVLLPRIYSPQGNHIAAYKNWVRLPAADRKPSLGTNVSFMFKYQIGFMYWRYFMWNFAGRESDIQNAAWLRPWDTTKDLPKELAGNKARNQFFMLPLILGLAGLYFQLVKGKRDAFIVGLLFFFTGIAIVIYLNQPPVEPRERDYTFAGSYYAFCVWIGLGVLAIDDLLKKYLGSGSGVVAGVVGLAIPGIMAVVGWDDHNRSNRYHSVDSAKNLLASCAKNAILFTGGDNDTFPLWYVQEVEGFRTDVRVCNLSLLGTDWYGKQMLQKAYDSDILPMTLEPRNFAQGKNDYLPFYEIPELKSGVDLKRYIELVKADNPAVNRQTENGSVNIMPTKTFVVPVDREAVKAMGYVPTEDTARIIDNLVWTLNKPALYKSDLLMLDMLANNGWKRPIYFSTTLSNSNYIGLKEYMYMEGLAYRLMPVKNPGAQEGVINTPVMYKNMMEMRFKGLDNPNAYFDENYKRFPLNARKSYYMLAAQLVNEAQVDTGAKKAEKEAMAYKVIQHCLKAMPNNAVRFDFYMPQFVPLLLQLGKEKEANAMADQMAADAEDDLKYYTSRKKDQTTSDFEVQTNVYVLQQLVMAYKNAGKATLAAKYEKPFNTYMPFAQASQAAQDPGSYEEE